MRKLITIYKKVLGAKIDENAKKMIIQKISLLFGKLFITNDVKIEALSYDSEMVQEQANNMVEEVVPKLELSYMGTDIWTFLDLICRTQALREQFKQKYSDLYESLKSNWGEQIVREAVSKINALESRIKKLPPNKQKTPQRKIDTALQIKIMFN